MRRPPGCPSAWNSGCGLADLPSNSGAFFADHRSRSSTSSRGKISGRGRSPRTVAQTARFKDERSRRSLRATQRSCCGNCLAHHKPEGGDEVCTSPCMHTAAGPVVTGFSCLSDLTRSTSLCAQQRSSWGNTGACGKKLLEDRCIASQSAGAMICSPIRVGPPLRWRRWRPQEQHGVANKCTRWSASSRSLGDVRFGCRHEETLFYLRKPQWPSMTSCEGYLEPIGRR